MDLSQLKSGDKVKIKLVQPEIKCTGRIDVSCYYRGIVDRINEKGLYLVIVKSISGYGPQCLHFTKDNKCVTSPLFEDLQIYKRG